MRLIGLRKERDVRKVTTIKVVDSRESTDAARSVISMALSWLGVKAMVKPLPKRRRRRALTRRRHPVQAERQPPLRSSPDR